ncbi:MAG: PaaI family thioesterase [Candidatus Methylomirabilales bacterium]
MTPQEKRLLEQFRSLGEEGKAELVALTERLAAARNKQKLPHFRDLIGEQVAQGESGQTEVQISVKPFLLNRSRVVHGGVVCTLMDEAIGWAVHASLGEGGQAVTAELKINFLAPATSGTVIGRGQVIRQGKHLVIGEGDILDQQGKLLARGLGTWMITSP